MKQKEKVMTQRHLAGFDLIRATKQYDNKSGKECIQCGNFIKRMELEWLNKNGFKGGICIDCLESNTAKPNR